MDTSFLADWGSLGALAQQILAGNAEPMQILQVTCGAVLTGLGAGVIARSGLRNASALAGAAYRLGAYAVRPRPASPAAEAAMEALRSSAYAYVVADDCLSVGCLRIQFIFPGRVGSAQVDGVQGDLSAALSAKEYAAFCKEAHKLRQNAREEARLHANERLAGAIRGTARRYDAAPDNQNVNAAPQAGRDLSLNDLLDMAGKCSSQDVDALDSEQNRKEVEALLEKYGRRKHGRK